MTLSLILFTSLVKPCGVHFEEHNFFYSLFDQKNISAEEYYPFLRSRDTFYDYEREQIYSHVFGNLELWQEILTDWKLEEIYHAVYSGNYKSGNGTDSKLEQNAKQYMTFARKCSRKFNYRNKSSWDYDDILNNNPIDVSGILEEGMSLFQNEANSQLKLRYAYQLIRIFHYSRRYQEARVFFENQVESQSEKNEIYYYALDQVAGCYYSLGDYEKAAYLFLQVLGNSKDRKKSALKSYKFCTRHNAEGKTYFTSIEDTAIYITVKNMNIFYDRMNGLQELYELVPGDERVELLFARSLNNLEREIWPKHVGMERKHLPVLKSENQQELNKLHSFVQNAFENPAIENKEFWLLALSYLTFLNNDLPEAGRKLKLIKSKKYNDQKQVLADIYEVFSWKEVSKENELFLASVLNDAIEEGTVEYWDPQTPDWKFLIMDQAAHLYYKNGKLAESFLMHNELKEIERISSLELIDDLFEFVNQSPKNEFEKLLAQRTDEDGHNALDYLNRAKGIYYLKEGRPQEAYQFLNKSALIREFPDKSIAENIVPATIFSNNIMECFSCPETEVMTDSVFLTPIFNFIKPEFSKANLAEYLIKLDSIASGENAERRKLASYLLGNYYFNISNTGFYRGTLTGKSNCCHSIYASGGYHGNMSADSLIQIRSGYNMKNISRHYKTYYGLSKTASEYYQNAIANSTDKELNARSLYMLAKCELNTMYKDLESTYYGYDGSISEKTKPYKSSFEKLKQDYSDTEFYDMIIEECSFFEYYVSQ